MAAFMVAPMVAWMRVRGSGWRDGAQMSAAMLVPVSAVLVLRGMSFSDALPWLSNSEHIAMLVGMLVFMRFRRERYTSGYSLFGWPVAGRQSSRADLAEAAPPTLPAGPG
jgi:hypothetical protein